MHPIVSRFRNIFRSHGLDVVRHYPVGKTLQRFGIGTVLDVGANVGQYASSIRAQGYCGRILSFEPVSAAFQHLEDAAKDDPQWQVFPYGLGSQDTQMEMFVDGHSGMNSLLPARKDMPLMKNELQKSREVVEIRRLNSVFKALCEDETDLFLKIDTQGHEMEVLKGAEERLGCFKALELELSLTPLYQNQPCLPEVAGYLYERGFKLWSIDRGIADVKTGETYEVEGIFVRI